MAASNRLRGRDLSSTKVKTLPASLGNCTKLQQLCARPPAPFRGPRIPRGIPRAHVLGGVAIAASAGPGRRADGRYGRWRGAFACRHMGGSSLETMPHEVNWPELKML